MNEFSPTLLSNTAVTIGKQASVTVAFSKHLLGQITNISLSSTLDQQIMKIPDALLDAVMKFTSTQTKMQGDAKYIQLHPFSAALRTLLVLSSNGIVTPPQIFSHVLVFLKGPNLARDFGFDSNGMWKLIRVSLEVSPITHVKSIFQQTYKEALIVSSNDPVVVKESSQTTFDFVGLSEHASQALWEGKNLPCVSDIIYMYPTLFEGASGKSLFSRSSTIVTSQPVNKFGMYRMIVHPTSSIGPCLLSGKFDVSKHDPDVMINMTESSSMMQIDYSIKNYMNEKISFLITQSLNTSMLNALQTCSSWVSGISPVQINAIKSVSPVSSMSSWMQQDIKQIRGLSYWLNNVLVTTSAPAAYLPVPTIFSTSKKIDPVKLETATHLLLKYDSISDESLIDYRTGPGITHSVASIFSVTPTQKLFQKLPALSPTSLHQSEVDGTLPPIDPLISLSQSQVTFNVGSIPLQSFVTPICNISFLKSVLSSIASSYLTPNNLEICIAKQFLLDYYELKRVWKERKVTEMRRNWIREDTALKQAGYDTSTRNMPDFASSLETGPHNSMIVLERNLVANETLLAEILGILKTLK